MNPSSWKTVFDSELINAASARLSGNEGKARVCARRAAGAAIGEYFRLHTIPSKSLSAYDRLRQLAEIPGLPARAGEAVANLMLRVREDYSLPGDVDLIYEAQVLAELLLPGEQRN